DASLRSYIREHAPHLIVEDSRPTHEEAAEAYRMVSELLETTEDLVGILMVGGGISGVLRALREVPASRREGIRFVCRDIGPETRKGLCEGLITAALCHPLEATSGLLIQTMIEVINQDAPMATLQRTIPFDIVTPGKIRRRRYALSGKEPPEHFLGGRRTSVSSRYPYAGRMNDARTALERLSWKSTTA